MVARSVARKRMPTSKKKLVLNDCKCDISALSSLSTGVVYALLHKTAISTITFGLVSLSIICENTAVYLF